jgi:hypothetical protein
MESFGRIAGNRMVKTGQKWKLLPIIYNSSAAVLGAPQEAVVVLMDPVRTQIIRARFFLSGDRRYGIPKAGRPMMGLPMIFPFDLLHIIQGDTHV